MQKDTYEIVRWSTDKVELINVIRNMVPGTLEARCLISCLERNNAYDAELRLEVLCKAPDRYQSYEYVDYIIQCANNTELLKRLYTADESKFGPFVAVNITEEISIVKMYQTGTYEVRCAAVSNTNASEEFLKNVIAVTADDNLRNLAYHTLREISSA